MTPLEGVRVVSLAINLPGPLAAARLRDLGAAVLKVEPPDGDPLAFACPDWYRALHQHQEVARLNLKEADDRNRLDAALEGADLLLTAFRPSALERLGLSWDRLAERFPQLCQVAIVGHPSPHEDRPGHDLTYQARLGLLSPPTLPSVLVADLAGAQEAVTAALALLLGRQRGRAERWVQVSLAEAAERFAGPLHYGLTAAGGILGGGFPGYGLYAAREGWVALAALEVRFRERLTTELALPDFTRETLQQALWARTASEWEAWAIERDLPLAAVRERSLDQQSD